MTTPIPRRIAVTLPPLTPAQADAVFQLIAQVQDAFWNAYENELLDTYDVRVAAEREVQIEAEALDDIWPPSDDADHA